MLLSRKSLEAVKNKKNLLAFSAGVDSSALFFLLLEKKIDFDIALVNYHTRESSSKEAKRARELAKRFQKKVYIKETLLQNANFEHEARKIRYSFFEEIITKHRYDNLLTAHHLNDRLEWFLMQFCKGAGVVEMIGFEEIEKRERYTLIRPLIECDKKSLKEYLDKNEIKYFIDESNFDTKYRRNYFRKEFSNRLVDEFKEGIKKSFRYLGEDKSALFKLDVIKKIENLYILKRSGDDKRDIRQIDKVLKIMGYILSSSQRDEILRQKDIVIANSICVALHDKKIYISPFVKKTMPKTFKNRCQKEMIPPKIRPYLYMIGYDFT